MKYVKPVAVIITGIILCLACLAHAADPGTAPEDFSFVQLTDTHWGFNNPAINPDWAGTLKKAIADINSLDPQPDFVMVTGDLTHTTDDPKERRKRLSEFRDMIQQLKVKDVRFIPGEHDAGLDQGAAYKEFFGETHYVFEHKGVHFIAIDNASDPTSSIGDVQLQWLGDELKKLDKKARIVVFTHRPLFDLYPAWDWWTRDGAKAIELLKPYQKVAVFYGHIHQDNSYWDGNITERAGHGMMYPLPAPGSVPKKAPVPWAPAQPYKGLGFRSVLVKAGTGELVVTEYPITKIVKDPQAQAESENVIKITARKFEYSPSEVKIKKGVPVVLELTSADVAHGFNCPGLGVRADVRPGKVSTIHLVATKAGSYDCYCDIFCGEGHADMKGKIIVEE